MNQNPQVPDRKLSLPTSKQAGVLASHALCLTEAKQLTLVESLKAVCISDINTLTRFFWCH
jgi:hypothetical protein